jgi:hypothetical protein
VLFSTRGEVILSDSIIVGMVLVVSLLPPQPVNKSDARVMDNHFVFLNIKTPF